LRHHYLYGLAVDSGNPQNVIVSASMGPSTAYSVEDSSHLCIERTIMAKNGRLGSYPLADEALDVAIFSLSLMGKNWQQYITEAKRCLVTNGILIIAETTKSLKGRLSKLRDLIKEQGFEIYSDEERGDFTFIEARDLSRSKIRFFRKIECSQ
jgi:SAM-dependent methyltransferase